jgi:hypothetical protein
MQHRNDSSPQEVLDQLSAWFRIEAEKLPDDAQKLVLRALENRHTPTVGIALYELQNSGRLPLSWKEPIDAFWSFAR